jgi:hypothetical protein
VFEKRESSSVRGECDVREREREKARRREGEKEEEDERVSMSALDRG